MWIITVDELEVWNRANRKVKNNEITTRVHEECTHNISFFSIPAQFPLNVFYLRFSYAYLTAKPVSYTHLDVYKRQVLKYRCQILFTTRSNLNEYCTFQLKEIKDINIDVYKRQHKRVPLQELYERAMAKTKCRSA